MQEAGFDYQIYLKMVLKRRRLFIFSALAIMSVIVWGGYLLPKKYEAKSTVFVETNVITELVKGIAITPEMMSRVEIVGEAMLSRSLIADTLKALDLDAKTNDPVALEKTITDFQKRTRIQLRLRENLFSVSITDSNPKLAQNYVNTLVSKYIEMNLSAKKQEAVGASTFLDEQVAAAKAKLDKAEQEIIDYRREKGVYMATDENAILMEIRAYNTQMQQIRMRRNELAATTASLKKQLKGEDQMIPVFTPGRPSSSGAQSRMTTEDRQIALLEERLAQLSARFKENYPDVVKLKAEIEALKKLKQAKQAAGTDEQTDALAAESLSTMNPTYQQLKDRLLAAEAELSALEANQNHVAGMIREKEIDLRSLPTEKKRLMELENDRNAQKQLYDQLKIRLEQSTVSRQMELSDKSTTFRVVDPAALPAKPVSPKMVMMILMGIIAGFGGGFGVVFLKESISPSVKSAQTLKDMGLTVLAVIPRMFDTAVQTEQAKKDRKLYVVAGSYLLIICSVLLLELLGITLVDKIIAKLHLDGIVGG